MSNTTSLPFAWNPGGLNLYSGGYIDLASGASINVGSGGTFKIAGTAVTSSAAELNTLDGVATTWQTKVPGTHTFTIGAEGGNVINVAVQLNDIAGTAIAASKVLYVYLSDSAVGDGLTATAPSGGTAIGTDGTLLEAHTATKSWQVWTESDGQFDVNITEAGAATWYMVVTDGFNLQVSAAITFA